VSTRLFGALVALLTYFGVTGYCRAEDMDLALSRLSVGDCERTLADSGEPFALRVGGEQTLAADQEAWRKVITQIAPLMLPPVLAPVTTSGPRGVDIALQTSVTGISANTGYWKRGSLGHGGRAVQTCDGRNGFVASTLTQNRLAFDKGLPLGFTMGAHVGRVWNTSLWSIGGNLKWALVEGFRKVPAPDVALRATGSTVVGDAQFSLTTLTTELLLSKNLVAASVVQLAPFGGAGMAWSFASSELIDLTPNIDAVACAAGTDATCNREGLAASSDDIGHDVPFRDLSLMRYRAFAGLMFRYGVFSLAGEFAIDILAPHDADKAAGAALPRQWTVSVAPALSY
jgi:hypothetical protein